MYGCTICEYKTKQKGLLKVRGASSSTANWFFKLTLPFFAPVQVHINSVHYNMKVYNCELCKFCSIQKGNLR